MFLRKVLTGFVAGLLMSAASPSGAKVHFGIKVGLDTSNILVLPLDAGVNRQNQSGALGGFCVNLPVGKHFSVEAEAGLAVLGWRESYSYDDPYMLGNVINVTSSTKLAEVEFPVLGRFAVGAGNFKVLFTLGPTFGVIWDAMANVSDNSINTPDEVHFTKDLKTLNLGWTLGTGGELPVGKGRIALDARVNIGLSNIRKPDPADFISISMSTLEETLGLTYFFF